MARKTGKDYQREFIDLFLKKEGFDARVRTRLLDLCKAHPNAIIKKIGDTDIKAESIAVPTYINGLEITTVIAYIIVIEEWLLAQQPMKQGKLFN